MEPPALAHYLAGVATQLQAEPTEGLTLQSIVDRALEVVDDADWASLTVRSRRRQLETLASTDPRAVRADELQYALAEGPCVDTVETADWFRSGSVRSDPRWPRWGPGAADAGVGSMLTVLVHSGSEPTCSLNLYAEEEERFADRDVIDVAILYAAHAANALTAARLVSGLEVAVESRHLIGMAQGIVMERFGLGVDQSFSLLRRLSSTSNTKLRDVARSIVETRVVEKGEPLPEDGPAPPPDRP